MAVQRKYLEMFLEEGAEIISKLNQGILRLEQDSSDTEALQAALRLAHTLKGGARMVGLDNVSRAAHWMEGALESATGAGSALTPGEGTRFLKTLDRIREVLGMVARGREREAAALEPRAPDGDPRGAPAPLRAGGAFQAAATPAGAIGLPRETGEVERRIGADRVRIGVEKLDALQNLVDDLVLQKTRLSERAQGVRRILVGLRAADPDTGATSAGERALLSEHLGRRELAAFLEDVYHLDQMVAELQTQVFELRMVPLAEILDEYYRLVRDLAQDLSKEVGLVIDGKLTEIDKRLLDAIQGPLTHLVRNAVDHGLEPPEERVRIGKPPRGQVTIRAYHKSSTVVLEVEDDGRGLDPERLRQTAVARGIWTREEARNTPDEEVHYLLCEPGFTTRDTVTEVSGRGVGLDVVRVEVEKLKGALSIQSEKGKFTRFRLYLPLSISSLPALLVRAADLVCAVPSLFVERCIRINPDVLTSHDGTWAHEGRVLQVVSLARALGLEPRPGSGSVCLVVARFRNRKMALQVDGLVAEREIVMKPLGSHLQEVPFVLGASLLGDGSVVPVLSVLDLHAQWARLEAACRFQACTVRRASTVLVVDDSLTTRHLEANILETLGYTVLQAADGIEAWRILEREPVDLVLTDIEMPGMDGLQLTQTIRKSPARRSLPVVAVSNRTRTEDLEAGRAAGIDAYIRKDRFNQAELGRTLSALLSGAAAGRGPGLQ